MAEQEIDPIAHIQALIDGPSDVSQAPPYVRGMDLSGVAFKSVSFGHFDIEWTVAAHLTHFDGIVQGGIVNVIADTGQSFAFWSTSKSLEAYSTSEFTTRFFRSIKTGDVIDVLSEVVNRSRRLCVIETKMLNQKTGKLCAIVTGTWMVVDRDFG